MIYTRTDAALERASVNAEEGTFKGVLFTDGEASDGHILNIPGGKIPERMPMFVGHFADPVSQLGSMHFDSRSAHQIRVRGQIEVGGTGQMADIRQDVLHMMAQGHVKQLSGRWDDPDETAVRRTSLEKGHPAFVDDKREKSWRKRSGLWFERWVAQEGSVVGLGADPQAVARHCDDDAMPEHVQKFWRGVLMPVMDREVALRCLDESVSNSLRHLSPMELADYMTTLLVQVPEHVEQRASLEEPEELPSELLPDEPTEEVREEEDTTAEAREDTAEDRVQAIQKAQTTFMEVVRETAGEFGMDADALSALVTDELGQLPQQVMEAQEATLRAIREEGADLHESVDGITMTAHEEGHSLDAATLERLVSEELESLARELVELFAQKAGISRLGEEMTAMQERAERLVAEAATGIDDPGIQQLFDEELGNFGSELREQLDRQAYSQLGIVPPRVR